MVFKIPRPVWTQAIVDKAGLATKAFSRRIEEAFGKLETQEATQDANLALLQQVQANQAEQLLLLQSQQAQITASAAAANNAQAAADSGPSGTATSGSATDTAIAISGTAWQAGPTVNLTGVAAGNLTITGTSPIDATLGGGNIVAGEFRLVELVGSTTIFTGNFSVSESGLYVSPTTTADVAAFSLAEITTGAVSYRMDVRRSGGTSGGSAFVDAYFFARRS